MKRLRLYVGRFLMRAGLHIMPKEAHAHIFWNENFLRDRTLVERTGGDHTMQLVEDGVPRRQRLDLHTPAERAIRDAVVAVEAAGAHPLLTDAVNLLHSAREKVADYVELGR